MASSSANNSSWAKEKSWAINVCDNRYLYYFDLNLRIQTIVDQLSKSYISTNKYLLVSDWYHKYAVSSLVRLRSLTFFNESFNFSVSISSGTAKLRKSSVSSWIGILNNSKYANNFYIKLKVLILWKYQYFHCSKCPKPSNWRIMVFPSWNITYFDRSHQLFI